MTTDQVLIKRTQLIIQFGELLPLLEEKVYREDFISLSDTYHGLLQQHNNRSYITLVVAPRTSNLREIIGTSGSYEKNQEGRELLQEAVGLLEAIIKSYRIVRHLQT